jgi:monoamine oxidase
MPSDSEVDVLIVGAGFTGLSAATELKNLGVRFRIIDAYSDHVGGRAYSYDPDQPAGTALRFDHGAEYVGDMQNEIMALIARRAPNDLVNGANLRIGHPHEVMVLAGERYVFASDDALLGIPGVPPQLGLLNALSMIGLLAEMTIQEMRIDVVQPWEGAAGLLQLDTVTVEQWLGSKAWVTPPVADLVRISVEALLSVELDEISPYYLLWYTACNGGFLNEVNDGAGGPQQYWLRGGTAGLARHLADESQLEVQGGVRVSAVDLTGDRVVVTTTAGDVIRARKVVMATSPASAKSIAWTPAPPPGRKELIANPMGRTFKCQAYYKTQWWHDSNGKNYDGYVGGANYPILWVMDNTPPVPGTAGPFVLMTFTVGKHADELRKLNPTKAEVQAYVTKYLRELFQDDRALDTSDEFIKLEMHGWTPEDTFVGGGPNTILAPGQLTGAPGQALGEPWDEKVFFASAEEARNLEPRATEPTWSLANEQVLPSYDGSAMRRPNPPPPYASRYSDMRGHLGYMDGAMTAGRWTAHRVAQSLGNAKANARVSEPAPKGGPLVAPPPVQPWGTPAQVDGVLDALASRIEAAEAGAFELDARFTRHQGILPTWLASTLLELLAQHQNVNDDTGAQLVAIRDFAATAVARLLEPEGNRQAAQRADRALADRRR